MNDPIGTKGFNRCSTVNWLIYFTTLISKLHSVLSTSWETLEIMLFIRPNIGYGGRYKVRTTRTPPTHAHTTHALPQHTHSSNTRTPPTHALPQHTLPQHSPACLTSSPPSPQPAWAAGAHGASPAAGAGEGGRGDGVVHRARGRGRGDLPVSLRGAQQWRDTPHQEGRILTGSASN